MMVRGLTEDQVRQAVEAIGVALNGDVPQVGARASFSVRPERLRIQADGAGRETRRNVYAARVEDHDYLGAVVRYYLRLGDGLMVKADEDNVSGIRYRSGETVSVEIPPGDYFVLPVAG